MTGQLDVAGDSAGSAVGVCGFGRCGSTMLMTMLDAGGVRPVVGSHLGSYELGDVGHLTRLTPAQLGGRSVKLLDHFMHFPVLTDGVAWKLIWLDRDGREQARSQAKLMAALGIEISSRGLRDLQRSYRKDRPRALERLGVAGSVLTLTFENVLFRPEINARRIAEFLAPQMTLDVTRAAAVVHRRSPRCKPDLAFELGTSA